MEIFRKRGAREGGKAREREERGAKEEKEESGERREGRWVRKERVCV